MPKGTGDIKEVKRRQIGVITVDSGLCWLGDPVYLYNDAKKSLGVKWEDVLKNTESMTTHKHFDHLQGDPGLGIMVKPWSGNGEYPVYAYFDENEEIIRVTIEFS